jgi:hypothetical protein
MTSNDGFIGRLESYLDEYEGVTPLPDAVRDAIRAELPNTKQTGPVRGLSRIKTMTFQIPAPARYGLAAAAIAAAVAIGANVFSQGGTGGPSATPTATPAQSASGPMSLVDSPTPDNLPAGDYFIDLPAYPARIDFELPAGWWHYWDGSEPAEATAHALLVLDALGGNGSGWGLAFTLANEVLIDPCDGAAGIMDSSVTESAEALAAAFSAWPAFPATVEDVSVAGFSGKRVEITADNAAPCGTRDPTLFRTPTSYDFGPEFPTNGPVVNQFTLLDVNGAVLVIWTTDFASTTDFEVDGGVSPDPEGHADHQVELHNILDSIVITPR